MRLKQLGESLKLPCTQGENSIKSVYCTTKGSRLFSHLCLRIDSALTYVSYFLAFKKTRQWQNVKFAILFNFQFVYPKGTA